MEHQPDIQSDLSRYPLPRLLFYLYKKRFLGFLEIIGKDGLTGRIYFREGLPVFSDLSSSRDVLGRVLLERGLINEEAFNMSLQQLAATKQLQGQILLKMGAIDERGLVDGLTIQLQRKLHRFFVLSDAPFALYSIEHTYGIHGEGAFVRVDPLWLIYHGVRNTFDMERMQGELDKLQQTIVRLRPGAEKLLVRYAMEEEENGLVALMNQGMTLEQLYQQSPLDLLETQMVIYTLWVTEVLIASPLQQQTAASSSPVDSASIIAQSGSNGSNLASPKDCPVIITGTTDEPEVTPGPQSAERTKTTHRPLTAPDVEALAQSFAQGWDLSPAEVKSDSSPDLNGAFSPTAKSIITSSPVDAHSSGPFITPPPITGEQKVKAANASQTPRSLSGLFGAARSTTSASDTAILQTTDKCSGGMSSTTGINTDIEKKNISQHNNSSGNLDAVLSPEKTDESGVYDLPTTPRLTEERPLIVEPVKQAGTQARYHTSTGLRAVGSTGKSQSSDDVRRSPSSASNPSVSFVSPQTIVEHAQLIKKTYNLIQRQTYFEVLGVPRSAAIEAVRDAYFKLAKVFHPDRCAALGLEELRPQSEEIFRKINEAHATLTNTETRQAYENELDHGSSKQAVQEALQAEMAFQKGTVFFRKKNYTEAYHCFKEAYQLNEAEGEHLAWMAWTTFCNPANERAKVLSTVKEQLLKSIQLSPQNINCHYYLGEVYLALGDQGRAKTCFVRVLDIRPNHIEAARHLRLMQMRHDKEQKNKGLLDRLRKK